MALTVEKAQEALASKEIRHYPTLETVLMVEKFIQEHSGEYTKYQMWKNLPRKVMYPTFGFILLYLYASGKIGVDPEGKVAWEWNPKLYDKYIKRRNLIWKPKKRH